MKTHLIFRRVKLTVSGILALAPGDRGEGGA